MIWDPIERLLWGLAISISIMSGLFYLNMARKKDFFNQKVILYGFAGLLFGFALTRIFSFLKDFQIIGIFTENTFYGNYDNYTPLYEIFDKLESIFFTIGFIIFILAFEITVKRTKYIITSINIIILILIIISPFNLSRDIFNYTIWFEYFLLVPFILFLYTRWSPLRFKAISSFLLFGLVLITLGNAFGWRSHKQLNFYPLIIGPILFILGSIVIILPILIDPKKIQIVLPYWIFFGILTISILLVKIIIDFIFKMYIGFLIQSIIVFFYSLILFSLIINDIKSEIKSITEKKDIHKKHPSVLQTFSKPQKLTEEEVSISKEKKICLVCKGKVARNNIFLCPECDTFYCSKCSEALTNLENACWVCETPFDESKPVRLPEIKEEEVVVEGVDQKKHDSLTKE